MYRSRDLQRRYRAILDEAKSGEVRVRDPDGTIIVLTPAERVASWHALSQAAANLCQVERVVEHWSVPIDPMRFGDWTWLQAFDSERVHRFIDEIREAIILGVRESSRAVLERRLETWRAVSTEILGRGADHAPYAETIRQWAESGTDTYRIGGPEDAEAKAAQDYQSTLAALPDSPEVGMVSPALRTGGI